jgi:FMN phosphatase YigB (HAD superfamily)/DNA-binding XRE family transcriptional regulator
MDEKGLGKRLQDARRTAGLTQQGLCQKSGLSYSTLAKIERGAIKAPSIFTIEKIAEALNISLDELIGTNKLSGTSIKQRHRSKSGISFVYFDINGCLVRFYQRAVTKMAHDSGKSTDIVETILWHYDDQVCRGLVSLDEFNKVLADKLQSPGIRWEDYYLSTVESMPGMKELLDWVSQQYGIGLLSNIMPGLIKSMIQQKSIPNVAYDTVIESSEVQALKPEAKIFEIATEHANCNKSEILLIDDTRANLMAADSIGWKVLWFDGYHPDESIARIRELLEPEGQDLSQTPQISSSLPKIFETL